RARGRYSTTDRTLGPFAETHSVHWNRLDSSRPAEVRHGLFSPFAHREIIMAQFLARMPRGLSSILFGAWVIGIGAGDTFTMNSPGINVVLGLLLIGAGIFTLLEP